MTYRTSSSLWLGFAIGMWVVSPAMAAEHGGKEHAGQGQAGTTTTQAPAAVTSSAQTPATTTPAAATPTPAATPAATPTTPPTAEEIRGAISKYVQESTEDEGAFYVDDEGTGQTRELTLDHVHDRVGKTGEYYYACADMKDTKTGELLDIDFDVEAYDHDLDVVDVRIHKINGKERYTYDANDNRIPVTP